MRNLLDHFIFRIFLHFSYHLQRRKHAIHDQLAIAEKAWKKNRYRQYPEGVISRTIGHSRETFPIFYSFTCAFLRLAKILWNRVISFLSLSLFLYGSNSMVTTSIHTRYRYFSILYRKVFYLLLRIHGL